MRETLLACGRDHLVPAPSSPCQPRTRCERFRAYVMNTRIDALRPPSPSLASLPQPWRRRRPLSTKATCWSPRCRWALPPPRCGSSPPAPTQWWTRRAGWARVHACATACRAGRAWIAWAARLVCALDMGRGSSLAVQPCCAVAHAHACSVPPVLRRCCPSPWRSSSRRCCKVRTLRHAHRPRATRRQGVGNSTGWPRLNQAQRTAPPCPTSLPPPPAQVPPHRHCTPPSSCQAYKPPAVQALNQPASTALFAGAALEALQAFFQALVGSGARATSAESLLEQLRAAGTGGLEG